MSLAKPAKSRRENTPAGSIAVQDVSKCFRKRSANRRSYSTVKSGLVQRLLGRGRGAAGDRVLHALDHVSFEVAPGAAVGIIGRNGSGKSTLLKLISGIYRPDSGRLRVKGRISALIELGAGFHPDFSGRENVYLGGIMYGLTRAEINEKFDSIVAYAELEDFIDDPVRTYSSGMYMRLGFSLAIHTDPDILLIDEVLAVGDAAFVNRCQDTISDLRRRGKTLVLVTHDLPSVTRWCDEAIWLEKGKIKEQGEPRWVIEQYLKAVEKEEERELAERNAAEAAKLQQQVGDDWRARSYRPNEDLRSEQLKRWGGLEVEITEVRMLDGSGEPRWLFHPDDAVIAELHYRINEPVDELIFGVGIVRVDGLEVFGTNSEIEGFEIPLPDFDSVPDSGFDPQSATGIVRFQIPRLGLLENSYHLDVAAHRSDGRPYDYHHRLHTFSVRSLKKYSGICSPEHRWSVSTDYRAKELGAAAAMPEKSAVGGA